MTFETAGIAERLTCRLAGHLLAGVSGGADSVFLFRVLLALREKGILTFETVHVNHGLRGQASDGDEAFVRELCSRNNVPCYVYHPDLGMHRDEDHARKARYAAFREAMKQSGAEALVLAHHMDDQAETFLLRLIRGAGAEGLSAMKPVSEDFGFPVLRPLLDIGRAEIRQRLERNGIPWREDESNQDKSYTRNSVRSGLLHDMEQQYPGVTGRIAHSALMLGEDSSALDRIATEEMQRRMYRSHLNVSGLQDSDRAIRKRVLRKWWAAFAGLDRDERNLDYQTTTELEELLFIPGGKMNLPGGLSVVHGREYLHMSGCSIPTIPEVSFNGQDTEFDGWCLKVQAFTGLYGNGKETQAFPKDRIAECVIRTRRPGDRIRPYGCSGTQKLQDYFVNRGIDAAWRDEVPLLCKGSEVLWVAGVGSGACTEKYPEQEYVLLKWMRSFPWQRG